MPLIDVQTALGHLVRAAAPAAANAGCDDLALDDRERAWVRDAGSSRGVQFTRAVQRSWCLDRAAKAAPLTFAIVEPRLRSRLLDDWVAAGGGTNSFVASEADALLEFVAARLPAPSHELTVCRLEQALLRAVAGLPTFAPPDPAALRGAPLRRVRRGRHAAIVTFYGRPREILTDLQRARHVPLSAPSDQMVAPGIAMLCRPTYPGERALWSRAAASVPVGALASRGGSHAMLEAMLRDGALEFAPN